MYAEEINKKVTLGGREYTITRKALIGTANTLTTLYEIIGKRGANGAIAIRQEGEYKGRPNAVGIAALERLNWWDIVPAFVGLDEAVAS
jgi:hypothetical protein